MLSSFIHPHVIPNLYDRLQNTAERRYFEKCCNHTVLLTRLPLHEQKHYFYICSTEEINSCSTRSNDMHKLWKNFTFGVNYLFKWSSIDFVIKTAHSRVGLAEAEERTALWDWKNFLFRRSKVSNIELSFPFFQWRRTEGKRYRQRETELMRSQSSSNTTVPLSRQH